MINYDEMYYKKTNLYAVIYSQNKIYITTDNSYMKQKQKTNFLTSLIVCFT